MLTWSAQWLIRTYQLTLSAFIGRSCRYEPSCSHYMSEAMGRFGFWAGGWMGLFRLLRCHPYGFCGFDPVPSYLPDGVCWYRPWTYKVISETAEKR